jgi:hypothetical protein
MPIPGVVAESDSVGFVGTMLALFSLLLLTTGIGGIIAGWMMIRGHRFGRNAGIAAAFAFLILPPFGMALGAYAIWVLFQTDTPQQ